MYALWLLLNNFVKPNSQRIALIYAMLHKKILKRNLADVGMNVLGDKAHKQ